MYIMNHLLLQRDSANVTIIKMKDTIKLREDEIREAVVETVSFLTDSKAENKNQIAKELNK